MKLATLILSVLLCNICYGQIPCNNWLSLPAINSSVSAGDLDIPGNQVTIEATINRTQPYLPGGGNDTEGDVVSKHNDFSDVNYLLRPNHAYITTTNGFFGTPDVCDIELNKVYHVALVYDGSTLKFYRDGFLMSQVPATGNLIQNNWQTRIGWYEPQGFTTQFLGFINEVRVWNVARTQAQMKTYMNASLASPATQAGLLAYYTFDNLINKQGTSLYNVTINGSATINSTVSNCAFTVDSCAILTQPQTCNGSLGAPVVNITFGNGSNNPGPELPSVVPGASTNYNFANYATGSPSSPPLDGDYALLNQVPFNSGWYTGSTDHTGDANGYMAFFNAAPNPGEFYRQTVANLCSGTTYEFAAWVTNVINPATLPTAVPPNITFDILDPNTQFVLATYNTGDIAATNAFTWNQYSLPFKIPSGLSSVILVLRNNNIGGNSQIGNDLAIDDITFRPCGPLTSASFSNTTDLDSTGIGNCNSINLYGKITGSFNSPAYQWQMSKDGGIIYTDINGATTLNSTYSGFTNGKYKFRLLSAETGNITSVNCRFISNIIVLTVSGCNVQNGISSIINDYTPVIELNNCTNRLTVEDAGRFNAGDTVLIIQMKGAIIDSSNSSNFGDVTDYKNAGNYEFNYVKSKSGNIIELKNILTRQYDLPGGKVQLIRVPYFQNAVISDTLTCLPWDGKKGGVLVLNAANAITLNADINVSGKGFKGGLSKNSYATVLTCATNDFSYPASSIAAADKGESIYAIGENIAYGKGANASGGGGGNGHNSGGGGGGNGGKGGFGGYQLEACGNAPFDNRGFGGNALPYNTNNKVFLGGGGGSGHTDNAGGVDMNGGNGGGIAIIISNTITNNGFKIISNGANAQGCDNAVSNCHDGSGGGGAAGTVLIKNSSFVNSINIESAGGKGGDLVIFNDAIGAGRIGPGGGGGGGAVWLSQNNIPANVQVNTNGGLNGVIPLDGNNPWGATAGLPGQSLLNLQIPVAISPFKPNIDSVRITSTSPSCNVFNFNGVAYINTAPINKWQWFFDDGTTIASQSTSHSYNTVGSHPVKLVVTDINGCTDSVTTNVVADALPANPSYVITQPTCANTFGSLSITNPIGSNFQYSIDATNYQVSPVFSNLPVTSYNLTVKNTVTNCISLPINLSINAASLPAAATTTVIQPSCTNPSGTINVTAPLAPDLQYSVDGTNYQTSTTFTNVVTGSYNLTVKNITSTCVSLPTNVTIDPPLTAPAIPSSNLTQPVCSNQNGSIAVTAPLGINLQYSIDDINYQAGINFNNIAPGNYRLTVKNTTTSCISLPASISILAGTGTPASPSAAVTIQPDCIVITGTATVSTPLGNNYQYSFDGSTFQAGTTFINLVPGSYNVSVKDIVNGCVSTTAPLTVNAIPFSPPAPEASVLQPTCAITTGTINVTSPTGNNIQYNINGAAFQSGTSFPGLAPSSYSLTTKNTNTQCISTAKIVVINPIPSPPAAPTVGNTIQPSCTIQKGTVTISAPAGTNFEYSINSSAYQAANSFTNLASGSYNLVVRDITTSCISTSIATTINPPPALPPTPVARVTEQPTCIISAGTIVVAAPSGGNYQYSVDGLQYQSSATFENLAPGTYQVTVRDQAIDCISLAAAVVVNANINSPGIYLIPTAFTPNHDGINECFGIKYWGVISEFRLIIYNRWGQTVFSTSNPSDCWDGIYKGVVAPVGNYVYYIKAKTLCGSVEKRGNVMLIR